MPYRTAAVNEAAVQDENELASVRLAFQRQRDRARRVVVSIASIMVVAFVVVLRAFCHDPPRGTLSKLSLDETKSTCSEDTCLCWSEPRRTWTHVTCPPPSDVCFRSEGTCAVSDEKPSRRP